MEGHLGERVLEHVHDDACDGKAEHDELHDLPERREVRALELADLLDAAVEEEEREAAVEDLEEDDDDREPANVIL